MWRRVGGAISCAVWLLLACGKSEHDTSSSNGDSAGSNAGGVPSGGGNANSSAGTPVSAAGTAALAGNATTGGKTTTGGSAPTTGGQPEAGMPAVGGEPSEGGAPSCSGSYRACGCGCCGGQAPPPTCVYADRGEDLAPLIAADLAKKNDLQTCSAAGCSAGVTYVCCATPEPSVEQADYSAKLLIGGLNRLELVKRAANCSRLTLVQPATPKPGLALEVPAGWSFERATSLPCSASSIGPEAIGAIGKIGLRVLGNACVADAHLTLFFSRDAQRVDAERFDADALPVDLPVASCH